MSNTFKRTALYDQYSNLVSVKPNLKEIYLRKKYHFYLGVDWQLAMNAIFAVRIEITHTSVHMYSSTCIYYTQNLRRNEIIADY